MCLAIIFCCCSDKNKQPQIEKSIVPNQKDITKKISINKIGELQFRRSYANNQLMKMSDAEYEKIRRSNPWGYDNHDTSLLKKFQKFGLVNKKYNLLLRNFKSQSKINFEHFTAEFGLWDSIQNKLVFRFIRNKDDSKYKLWITDNSINSEIQIDGFYLEGLKFMVLDIVPGGYSEIVILNNYYIMNGDNSDIYIYEISYN